MFLTLTREVIFFSSKDYAINQLPTLLTKCCSFIFSFSSQPFQNWSGKFVTQLAVKRNSTIVHLSSRSDKNSSGLRCRNLGCIFCTENVQIYKFLTLDMQSRDVILDINYLYIKSGSVRESNRFGCCGFSCADLRCKFKLHLL